MRKFNKFRNLIFFSYYFEYFIDKNSENQNGSNRQSNPIYHPVENKQTTGKRNTYFCIVRIGSSWQSFATRKSAK